ncbi:sulfatase-like hydrolase/transferase [Blastopirellula sp. JC732]|uniref:Sulfatase-like hydrolase/transferase n=1 Tax=Blastopirellula sediminis TaxID=2894196 RepID=A0A9X1MRG7_9BACT|nr:sulfatase-like hydrolase/transferase [Blastopirellula sediminis]MCC9605603.1 sulfatase-like hydrolase/transferase [Blastopirellula sediminis]MCC9631097.1 sulfatase-like hydrolase/transferase [Blastopirellula sediminis]
MLRSGSIALLLALWALPAISAAADPNGAKPNFLLILTDDQSYEAVGYRGMTQVQTPHLDQLAKRSLSFTHAYNQGSWSPAVCFASRLMLNTGRFVWHAEPHFQTAEKERQAGRFWSESMKRAGYDTYMTGKWHLRANAQKAFDHVGTLTLPLHTPEQYNRPLSEDDVTWQPWDRKYEGYWKGGKHASEIVGDEAVEFLHQAAQREQPFFMYVAFNAPHDPRQSPKRYVDMYPRDQIEVPANYLPEYPEKDLIGLDDQRRDERLAPFPRTRLAVQTHRQEYFAIITHMDEQIGKILQALRESGKEENTYVFFTSDHGLAVGHHGLMGKQNMYDHSSRVPLLMAGPSVEPGTNDAAVYLQDILPTTLELAGIAKPEYVEFQSLTPLIWGGETQSYDAIYNGYLDLQRSITQDGFKLIMYPPAGVVKLFDLRRDPLEMNNLAADPLQAVRRKDLYQAFRKWQQKTGDSLVMPESIVSQI